MVCRARSHGRVPLPHGRAPAAAPRRQPGRPGPRARAARRRGAVPAGRGRTGGKGRSLYPGRARAAVRARHLAPARLRPRRARRARRHVRHPGSAARGLAGSAEHEGATRLMTAPPWLLVAAAVLALVAGWCANAEAALALVSATGAAERAGDKHGKLAAVAADLPRYMSVLLLLRVFCEVFAAVLVTSAFVSWLGNDWRAVLSALAVVIGLRYLLTGVRPQTARVGPRTERTDQRAAAFLFPLHRALGPLAT